MQIKAQLNYLRIAPRKVRLVADLIRGKKVAEARVMLDFSLRKAAKPILKLLDSAVANNKQDEELEKDSLRVARITVDEGPKLKRWRARARGRAGAIQKKSSHITLVLEGEKIKQKAPAPAEDVKALVEKDKKTRTKPVLFRPRKEMTANKDKTVKKSIFRRKAF